MISATLLFQFSTVDARSQRATNRDNAHQRHTRSVQSSSCAEGSFFSSPICLHGLQPTRVVLRPLLSHPLRLPNCNSLLISASVRRVHQIDAHPMHLRYAVPRHDFLLRGFNHRVHHHIRHCGCPAFTGCRDCVPRPLVYHSLPRVIKTSRLYSVWCVVVRSLTLMSVLIFFSENRPACAASWVQYHFTSRCRTRPEPIRLCMPRFAVLSVSTSSFSFSPASASKCTDCNPAAAARPVACSSASPLERATTC